MIIAAVNLSDIELDVDAERPERAKPKCYARRTGQVKSSREGVRDITHPLPRRDRKPRGHTSVVKTTIRRLWFRTTRVAFRIDIYFTFARFSESRKFRYFFVLFNDHRIW